MEIYASEIQIPRPGFLGGDEWFLHNLAPITVIFGKNSAGKSILLRAWREQDVENTHYVTPERGGEFVYEPVQIQHQQNPQGRLTQTRHNFIPNYRQQVIARITSYFAVRGDYRGDDKLPGDPGEIEQLISLLIPDFTVAISSKSNPPFILTRASETQPINNVQQLSSGEAQILTLGLDILTIAAIWDLEDRATRLLFVDEPDAHLHPDLQVRLADFLYRVARLFKVQIVVATHNTTLLAALGQFGGDNASVIYLDRLGADFTARRFDAVMKEVAACLGGHVLMGPLFGAPLLLVEGDDDYRIWSQVPRHHKVNIAVIPSHGDEIRRYQRTLEKIFTSLADVPAEPLGYALLDGDKPLPTPNPNCPQNYIKFVRLACHEAENLYLTDEVLADLDLDWEKAARLIVAAAPNHGNKTAALSQAPTWERATVDLKLIIKEIELALDTKRVNWTNRVGQVIGRNRPTGQLASFLGEGVLSAIWGPPPPDGAEPEPDA